MHWDHDSLGIIPRRWLCTAGRLSEAVPHRNVKQCQDFASSLGKLKCRDTLLDSARPPKFCRLFDCHFHVPSWHGTAAALPDKSNVWSTYDCYNEQRERSRPNHMDSCRRSGPLPKVCWQHSRLFPVRRHKTRTTRAGIHVAETMRLIRWRRLSLLEFLRGRSIFASSFGR
ncbi:hypothetical protein K431DRAFT_85026 [Polychaeton citri CBS 116435]|uniref:Uncharacterized protein n=1 Tax=Polychaeton citri CBS 116435 TaxID=1314669 RepID=A0A9P4Q5C9_9PEZI|nr:hypothetical protein K431DRAFT_85026 [Polychaeton citri CBS 116435]